MHGIINNLLQLHNGAGGMPVTLNSLKPSQYLMAPLACVTIAVTKAWKSARFGLVELPAHDGTLPTCKPSARRLPHWRQSRRRGVPNHKCPQPGSNRTNQIFNLAVAWRPYVPASHHRGRKVWPSFGRAPIIIIGLDRHTEEIRGYGQSARQSHSPFGETSERICCVSSETLPF